MEAIKTDRLKILGCGSYGKVFRLSKSRVLKVYFNNGFSPHQDMSTLVQEIDAGLKYPRWALPVLGVAIAEMNGQLYHAAIKEYIPYRLTKDEEEDFYVQLPGDLRWDFDSENVRKDKNSRFWVIDTHD
jgi:hypothetical protein